MAMMFPSPVHPNAPTPYPHDRGLNYSTEQPHSHNHVRSQYEPPRPLEPRPTLHSSLSDTTSLQQRQEPLRSLARPPDFRGNGPSLPGLRDIFSPAAPRSSSPSFSGSWHQGANLPSSHQTSNRTHYASPSVHPPMIIEPSTGAGGERRPRSYEVPILQTSSDVGHRHQPVPMSPYGSYAPEYGYSPGSRYERPPVTSAGPYMSNGAPSPYGGAVSEASPLHFSGAAFDRYASPNLTSHSAIAVENQKKYIGVKDVPGEGAFHCYEGGFRIPTQVDGEQVNPAWGLTKANKPRKRLALACLECREKKIKCEPGISSCIQCEKAKKPCRRTTGQQSQSETASNTTWSPGAASLSRKGPSTSDPAALGGVESDNEMASKRRSREDPSPTSVPKKKHRSLSPLTVATRNEHLASRDGPTAPGTFGSLLRHTPKEALAWEDDPFVTNRDLTLHLMELYFTHFNNAAYCLFPRHHFMEWLKSSRDKCHLERMVLCSMLAMASVFGDSSVAGFGKQCAQIAMDSLLSQAGKINMCVVQCRMMLTLYNFAHGDYTTAWELTGSAVRTVTYLRYHTEEGCLGNSGQSRTEFAFSAAQYAECKRRTFWSVFLMDRYCQPSMVLLKPEDIFLRLPCTEEMYERGLPSEAPYLNNNIVDPTKALLTPGSSLAPMAWHVLVAAVWGDIIDFISRAPYRAAADYRDAYESFYAATCNRLQGWLTRLPEHLHYSEANLDRSIQNGYAGTFICIHALYHLCLMKLNRSMRHSLAPDAIPRNIRAAHEHGHRLLQIMCAVQAARRETVAVLPSSNSGHHPHFAFSTPFPGYATLAAVDIISAGGSDSTLATTLDDIRGGLGCLHELSAFWTSARDQTRACEKRFYQIQNILTHPNRARGGAWLGRNWGLEKPLELELGAEDDCIYGLGDSNGAMGMYFDAFRDVGGHAKASAGALRIS